MFRVPPQIILQIFFSFQFTSKHNETLILIKVGRRVNENDAWKKFTHDGEGGKEKNEEKSIFFVDIKIFIESNFCRILHSSAA